MLDFMKCFQSVDTILWGLSFILLMWCIALIEFQMVNPVCILGINFSWSWCCLLIDLVCLYFVDYFCVCIHKECYFPLISLSGLDIKSNTGLIE